MAEENPKTLEDLEMPHFMDRLPNGRCRAWWMAYEACLGKSNAYEWATENVHKFVKRAAKMDAEKGILPACRAAGIGGRSPVRMTHNRPVTKPAMKPVRRRTRAKG